MLLVVFGPPAVGKMSIGREVCARSGFHLFHNHMTIEPLLETFGFGTPGFDVLNGEFRTRVLQEAARNGVDLLFSVVWALDSDDDRRGMEQYARIFDDQVAFVELRAGLDTRLRRNRTEERLVHKASKRDLEWSDGNLRQMELEWAMTSAGGAHQATALLSSHPHLVLDTEGRTVEQSAQAVLEWLAALPRRAPAGAGPPRTMPRLSGDGVLLRAFTADDVQLVQSVHDDPLVPLITTVPTSGTARDALDFIARQHLRLARGTGYSFAIADPASGEAMGQIGLWLKDLDSGRASTGYWVAPRFRGRGVATAALHTLSDWALGLPGVERLELYVEPWNEGSWRAAEAAGFQREGLLRSWQRIGDERRDLWMYSRLPR